MVAGEAQAVSLLPGPAERRDRIGIKIGGQKAVGQPRLGAGLPLPGHVETRPEISEGALVVPSAFDDGPENGEERPRRHTEPLGPGGEVALLVDQGPADIEEEEFGLHAFPMAGVEWPVPCRCGKRSGPYRIR